MLFRCSRKDLLEIKRFDYVNDKEYYKMIIKLKKNNLLSNQNLEKKEDNVNNIYKLI